MDASINSPSDTYSLVRHNILSGLKAVERSLSLIYILIFFSISILSLSIALQKPWSSVFPYFIRYVSVAFMVAASASAVGGILGFLFGIPRLLQKYSTDGKTPSIDAPSKIDADRFFMTNTSLEEISDWLTKIIIGIGLVQFLTIVEYLHYSSMYSASFIEGSAFSISEESRTSIPAGISSSFLFCVIVVSLITSCLFVYLETRTRLTLMFLGMEAVGSDTTIFRSVLTRSLIVEEVRSPTETTPISTTVVGPDANDRILIDMAKSALKSPTEVAAWATAQIRSGREDAGEIALREASAREPSNVDILLRLAELRRHRGDQLGFVEDVLAALQKSPHRKDVLALARGALFEALYLPPPTGFQKAIEISEYLQTAPPEKQPLIQVRRAAAFGQKFSYLTEKTSPEAQEARLKALEAVQKVVKAVRNPDDPVRKVLRQIFDPKAPGSPRDDDLTIFFEDADFKRLIIDNDIGE